MLGEELLRHGGTAVGGGGGGGGGERAGASLLGYFVDAISSVGGDALISGRRVCRASTFSLRWAHCVVPKRLIVNKQAQLILNSQLSAGLSGPLKS